MHNLDDLIQEIYDTEAINISGKLTSSQKKDIKNKTKLQERKTGVKEGEDTEGKHKEGEWERKGPENEQQKREALCL